MRDGDAPAWKFTYDVQARNADGPTASTRLTGTRTGDAFELITLPDANTPVVARLSVITAQPYRVDAEPECLRKARALCHVLTVANANGIFEPITPPDIEELEGAKQPAAGTGLAFSTSVTTLSMHSIENERYNFEAAARVREDAGLRADLDTWRLAMTEEDGPTRLIHYFRIYEREA